METRLRPGGRGKWRSAVLSVACASGLMLIGPPAASASTFSCGSGAPAGTDGAGSCTYTTKGADSFIPPTGITQATFDVYGAQGGGSPLAGGLGGEATATIAVSHASAVQVTVGGAGATTTAGTFNLGGTNGGGNGGGSHNITVGGVPAAGWGGGGASDVRTGGCAPACNTGQRVIVAGGGGGRGSEVFSSGDAGGAGGDLTGGAGVGTAVCATCGNPHPTIEAGIGGGGGTQSAGGAGGASGISGCSNGLAGDSLFLGTGGDGGIGAFFCNGSSAPGGGGGGGGYHGGGGGGNYATFATAGGGGGGSSYGPDGTTFHSGVQSGNGKIVVSWSTDSTAPVVTISTSAVQAGTGWYNAASSGTSGISVSVSAADDLTGVTNITCTDGATTVLNTALSSDSFSLTDGMHSISCTATDGAANTGAAAGSTAMPATFSVDQTAPALAIVQLDAPGDGFLPPQSFTSFPANAVGAQPVTLSGTVSDATSGVASVTVGGTGATVSSGNWSLGNLNVSTSGTTFSVTATDTAGNAVSPALTAGATFKPDLDNDGIYNNVDGNSTVSPAVSQYNTSSLRFSDKSLGGTTSGKVGPITGSPVFSFSDLPAPQGLQLACTGSGKVSYTLDGKTGTGSLNCPGSVPVTDPDITIGTVVGGPAEVDEILNGTTIVIVIPDGANATIIETTSGGTLTDVGVADVTTTGVTINGSPVTPGVTVALGKLGASLSVTRGSFSFSGTFTPGPSSDGVQRPLTEDVTLKLGSYVFVIPAGSFHVASDGSDAYSGTLLGVKLSVQLRPARGGKWSVKANGKSVSGLANPVAVGLTIGNDTGVASITLS